MHVPFTLGFVRLSSSCIIGAMKYVFARMGLPPYYTINARHHAEIAASYWSLSSFSMQQIGPGNWPEIQFGRGFEEQL